MRKDVFQQVVKIGESGWIEDQGGGGGSVDCRRKRK